MGHAHQEKQPQRYSVQLFDAVFDQIVELTVSAVHIDADHLPDYAGRLYDASLDNPAVMRFLTWYQLERGESAQRAVAAAAMREKVAAIKNAQQRGTVTGAMLGWFHRGNTGSLANVAGATPSPR